MVRITTGVLAACALILAFAGSAQAKAPKERVYLRLSGLG